MRRYKEFFYKYSQNYNRLYSLSEAVIHVDKYINILSSLFKENNENIFKLNTVEERFDYINSILFPYKIKLIIDETNYVNTGLIKGSNKKENITITTSFNVYDHLDNEEIFYIFKRRLLSLIGHELIHRGQYYLRISDFINFYAYEERSDNDYYKHTEEIMAYAWMGIENMRFHGYSDFQILDKVKNNNVLAAEMGVAHIYLSDLKDLDYSSFKRFIKYMYEYLKDPIKHDLKVEL